MNVGNNALKSTCMHILVRTLSLAAFMTGHALVTMTSPNSVIQQSKAFIFLRNYEKLPSQISANVIRGITVQTNSEPR